MTDDEQNFSTIGFHAALILNRLRIMTLLKNASAGIEVGATGIFSAVERAQIAATTSIRDGGNELAVRPDTVPQADFVTVVKGAVTFSQINDPIVGPDAIGVVKFINGPATVNVEPSKAMGPESGLINYDSYVTFLRKSSGSTSEPSGPRRTTPGKNPRVLIVIKTLAQALGSQVGFALKDHYPRPSTNAVLFLTGKESSAAVSAEFAGGRFAGIEMDSPGAQSNITEGSLSPEGRELVSAPGETEGMPKLRLMTALDSERSQCRTERQARQISKRT